MRYIFDDIVECLCSVMDMFFCFLTGFTILHLLSGERIKTIFDNGLWSSIFNVAFVVVLSIVIGLILVTFLEMEGWLKASRSRGDESYGLVIVAGILILLAGFGMLNHPVPYFPYMEGWKRYMFIIWMFGIGLMYYHEMVKFGVLLQCALDILLFVMMKSNLQYWRASMPKVFYLPLILYGVGVAVSVFMIWYSTCEKKRIIVELLSFIGIICGFIGITKIYFLIEGPLQTLKSPFWLVLLIYYIGKGILVFDKRKE